MHFPTVQAFAKSRSRLPGGVLAVLLCDSDRHATQSAARLARQGAGAIIAVGASADVTADLPMIRIDEKPDPRSARDVLNALFAALQDRWVLWLWNGEFFVFPYGETRTLADLAAFMSDERRRGLYAYALDLYANPLPAPADAVEGAALFFDHIGYHAFPRGEQTLRLYGGLGWRFEELTPVHMQQIGRTALLKPGPDAVLDREMLFGNDYDSVNCPWHNNPTGAVMSLRRSRHIMAHPAFPKVAHKLLWQGSTRFEWSSYQLLDMGMIEPGQWF